MSGDIDMVNPVSYIVVEVKMLKGEMLSKAANSAVNLRINSVLGDEELKHHISDSTDRPADTTNTMNSISHRIRSHQI